MVPAGWGDPAYGESGPAVAGREVWDKAHQPQDGIHHGQHTLQT